MEPSCNFSKRIYITETISIVKASDLSRAVFLLLNDPPFKEEHALQYPQTFIL